MKAFYFYQVRAIGKRGQIVGEYAIPRQVWDRRWCHDEGVRILHDWMKKAGHDATKLESYQYAPMHGFFPDAVQPGEVAHRLLDRYPEAKIEGGTVSIPLSRGKS